MFYLIRRIVVFGSLLLSIAAPLFAQSTTVQEGEWTAFLPGIALDEPNPLNKVEEQQPQLVSNISYLDQKDIEVEDNAPSVRIGSILIQSEAIIDHAMFDNVIEPFLGQELASDELAKLVQQIADVARSNGMIFADAYIPRQEIELGIVKIILTVGVIDEVRIEGSDNRAIRQLLDPMVGQMVRRPELERRLMLINNIPQIIVKKTELLKEGARRILLVRVEQRKKASGQLVLDNYGSTRIGPIRARLKVEAVALLDDSDVLSVTFRANPVDPSELLSASALYAIGLNDQGTRADFTVAWSRSDIDPRSGFNQRVGKSQYASLSLLHPITRSRTENLWVEGQLEYLKIEQQDYLALLQSDTVVTVSLSLSASKRIGSGWFRSGAQLRQGLNLFGANSGSNSLASRFDADGQFTSARAWMNWSGKISDHLTLRTALSGQIASEPLLSSEEMGIGGSFLGRAFEYYERSGDQGISGLLELGYEFTEPLHWLDRVQPFAFVDAGYVHNLQSGFGSGALVSAGGGLRADIGRVDIQIEAALPVRQSGDGVRDTSPKLNLQLGLEF